jgi:hypothetical protein
VTNELADAFVVEERGRTIRRDKYCHAGSQNHRLRVIYLKSIPAD